VQLGFGQRRQSNPSVGAPQLFYSRRIGLNSGAVIPIDVGGRVTGKTGRTTIGALNLQTATTPSARRVDPTSPCCAFAAICCAAASSAPCSPTARSRCWCRCIEQAFGVDGTFSFFNDLTTSGYFAQSNTEGRMTDNASYTGGSTTRRIATVSV
jgi:hypothetical protein